MMSHPSQVLLVMVLTASRSATIVTRGADPSRPQITATFSIVAVDPETGVVGAAVASKYPAVGRVVPYVRAGVGGVCTQHFHVPKWGEAALDIIDMAGRTAVHNLTAAAANT